MERFQELNKASLQKLHLADHIVTQTYPLVKDSKLLLVGLENLFLALSYAMGALLHYERLFKRVPMFEDKFSEKFALLTKIKVRYHIPEEYFTLLQEVRDILIEHKKSPIEFERKESYIICSDNYSFRQLTPSLLKKQIQKSKEFINLVHTIISQQDPFFMPTKPFSPLVIVS